jgi:hypothetical protein
MDFSNYDIILQRICQNNKDYIDYYRANNLSFESQEKIISLRIKEIAVAKSNIDLMKKNNYSAELIESCESTLVTLNDIISDFKERDIPVAKISNLCIIS